MSVPWLALACLGFGNSRSGVKSQLYGNASNSDGRNGGNADLQRSGSWVNKIWPEGHLKYIRLVIIVLSLCSLLVILTFVYFIVLDSFVGASARRRRSHLSRLLHGITSTVAAAMRTFSTGFLRGRRKRWSRGTCAETWPKVEGWGLYAEDSVRWGRRGYMR